MQYFVHNGYVGWSYGTPGNPQLISEDDAIKLMEKSGLTLDDIRAGFPPAQFAGKDEALSVLFGGNRFLQYGLIEKCGDRKKSKTSAPLQVSWNAI